jgi:membrane protease YdiL (CAAX protease family)
MSSIARSAVVAGTPKAPRWVAAKTAGVLLMAAAGTAVFVLCNTWFAEWIQSVVEVNSPVGMGLLFSAFPLAVGGVIVATRPRLFGVQLGRTMQEWPLIGAVTAAMCALAGLALLIVGTNPFSGASFIVEVIAVPVSEEVLFRGAMFTLVLFALSRFHPVHQATILAVLISGVVFGLAHLNNLGSYDPTFVVLQSIYATILGLSAGALRAATRSLAAPILMHAAVNLVAILI